LQFANLPGRAGQTLIMLITPLVVSIVLLVPDQHRALLGSELIALGLILGALLVWLNRPDTKAPEETWGTWAAGRFGPSVLTSALIVLAGSTLAAGTGGGLYWLAPAVLLAILAGLGNAWVLLIEILR
jgi:modulator of FtsH protease